MWGKYQVKQRAATARGKLMASESLVPRGELGNRGQRVRRNGERDSNGLADLWLPMGCRVHRHGLRKCALPTKIY